MGSQRRVEAKDLARHGDNGRIIENAASVRRRLRQEAAIVREDRILQLYAQGARVADIEKTMKAEFGVTYQRQVPAIVKRALERRASTFAPDVEAARTAYVMAQRELVEAYMPYALGGQQDPATGLPMLPDPKMALVVMKALDNIAEVEGAKAPRKAGDVNVSVAVQMPDNPDAARSMVLDQLGKEREKFKILDGQFTETGGLAGATAAPADTLPSPEINFPLGPAPD